MNQNDYSKIIQLAKTTLEEYSSWGQEEIVRDLKSEKESDERIKAQNLELLKANEENKNNMKKTMSSKIDATELLEQLKKQIKNCKKCKLGETRLNAVFGVGDPYADIMFIGEGPGFQEDHQGEPFIGRAGNLLDKIIVAMGFTRQTVFIANIVKCHPMKNPLDPELKSNDRPPTQEEMAICKPYLDKQIEIISPKVIVTLGSSSTKALLQTEETISNLRGKFQTYNGIKLMPTYHPAALLRNPSLKKDVWHDMQQVMAFIKKG